MVKFKMLEEIGTIISIEGHYARVSVPKKSSCEGCTAGTCSVGEQSMEIEALNKAGAVIGQRVRVMVHSYAYMKGSMIIYGIPAIFLVIGAVFGKEIMPRFFPSKDSDILSALFGFSFLLTSFILIKFWSQKQAKKTESTPVIEEILDQESE
jgi:sigma-E factor negative regulatory protein RseC